MDKLKEIKDVSSYITGYIKLADAKIAGYITIGSAISALLIPVISKWLVSHPHNPCLYFCWILFGIGITLFVAMLICALNAVSPRPDPAKSLVSFPDIAKMSSAEFTKTFEATSEKELTQEYAKHSAVLADIAAKKFLWLKRATNLTYAWVSIFLFLYLVSNINAIKT